MQVISSLIAASINPGTESPLASSVDWADQKIIIKTLLNDSEMRIVCQSHLQTQIVVYLYISSTIVYESN